jgi:chemotaxis regulatin CheY-phosphate phosphatase CheZ
MHLVEKNLLNAFRLLQTHFATSKTHAQATAARAAQIFTNLDEIIIKQIVNSITEAISTQISVLISDLFSKLNN